MVTDLKIVLKIVNTVKMTKYEHKMNFLLEYFVTHMLASVLTRKDWNQL